MDTETPCPMSANQVMHRTWRQDITRWMECYGDDWSHEIGFAGDRTVLDKKLYPTGGVESATLEPFTLWTEARIYFPVMVDGSLFVMSVPRHPCDEVCSLR